MKHPNAVSLAKRLLDSHIKRQVIARTESETEHLFRITDEEIAWAEDILATHLDACMKQGIHPDLTEAVADALAFALRRESIKSEEHTSELQSQSNLVCRLL